MPRWVVVCVLAALAVAAEPRDGGRLRRARRARAVRRLRGRPFTANTGGRDDPGPRRGGRRRAGPGASPSAPTPPLTPDINRADLVVGGNLTVDGGGGSVPNGRVTYGGTLTATGTLNALGGLHQAQPPFDFADEFTTLRERSAQWADLTPNGTVTGHAGYDVRFTGHQRDRATCSASRRSQLQGITARSSSTSRRARPTLDQRDDGQVRRLHRRAQRDRPQGPAARAASCGTSRSPRAWRSASWTRVDPRAQRGRVDHQRHLSRLGRRPRRHDHSDGFDAPAVHRLPAPRRSRPSRSEPLAGVAVHRSLDAAPRACACATRARAAYRAHWEDTDSGQSGDLTRAGRARTPSSTSSAATTSITSSSRPVRRRSRRRRRRTSAPAHRRQQGRHGQGTPPRARGRSSIKGGNDVLGTPSTLVAGAQATVEVPGRYSRVGARSARSPGATFYTISEPDPLGALVSVDRSPRDDPRRADRATSRSATSIDAPPEPPEPGPSRRPAAAAAAVAARSAQPLPAPTSSSRLRSAAARTSAVSERISPRVSQVGHVVTVTVRVRNLGPLPADGAVVREIPQVDPGHPNQVARDPRRDADRARATSPARARGRCAAGRRRWRSAPRWWSASGRGCSVPARSRAWSWQLARRPITNTTNNASVAGLVVARPSDVAVAVHAPAVARVGEPVSYRVVARGTGSDGAVSVRFCHRPPARLLMTSAPGTFRYRGRVCRDVARLGAAGSAPRSPCTRYRPRAPAGERCRCSRRPRRRTRGRPPGRTASGRSRRPSPGPARARARGRAPRSTASARAARSHPLDGRWRGRGRWAPSRA